MKESFYLNILYSFYAWSQTQPLVEFDVIGRPLNNYEYRLKLVEDSTDSSPNIEETNRVGSGT